jgi:hypothetical protein
LTGLQQEFATGGMGADRHCAQQQSSRPNVCFGSEADIEAHQTHVCFTPKADIETPVGMGNQPGTDELRSAGARRYIAKPI